MISLKESILSDMEETIAIGDKDVAMNEINSFINNHYYKGNLSYSILKKPNKDGKYVVNSRGKVRVLPTATQLVNEFFIWGKVSNFKCAGSQVKNLIGAPREVNILDCTYCSQLESLEGCPQKINKEANFEFCEALKTLNGMPEVVDGSVNITGCKSLIDLTGAPKQVADSFTLNNTDVVSLKGGPKQVGKNMNCMWCNSLESLEGAPDDVYNFNCSKCNKLKTLKGGPKKVRSSFIADDCVSLETLDIPNTEVDANFTIERCKNLISFENGPKKVGNVYYASGCFSVTSFKGLPDNLGTLYAAGLTKVTTLDYLPKLRMLLDVHFSGIVDKYSKEKIAAVCGLRLDRVVV